jgi:hypothetical protein
VGRIHEFPQPPQPDFEQRVPDGADVAKLERLRSAGGPLVGIDRNLDVRRLEVEQPGDQVGLETETVRVRMPAHHVVAKMDRKPVVITDRITTQQIHEASEGT